MIAWTSLASIKNSKNLTILSETIPDPLLLNSKCTRNSHYKANSSRKEGTILHLEKVYIIFCIYIWNLSSHRSLKMYLDQWNQKGVRQIAKRVNLVFSGSLAMNCWMISDAIITKLSSVVYPWLIGCFLAPSISYKKPSFSMNAIKWV